MQIAQRKGTMRLLRPRGAVPANSPAARSPQDTASSYSFRIERYAERIRATHDVGEIMALLEEALFDTRALAHVEELRLARQRVQHAERKIEALMAELESANAMACRDALTGALNRRGLDDVFTREAARADRRDGNLCLALLDLDDFKAFNDLHGHLAGDAALAHLARVASACLRPSDALARFGGEEFVLLLPETGADTALAALHRVQAGLARNPVVHDGRSISLSFSAGVARRRHGESQSSLVTRADAALYRAKQAGKNRVVPAPE